MLSDLQNCQIIPADNRLPGRRAAQLRVTIHTTLPLLRFRTHNSGKKAVRISGRYNRTPALPPDALTTGQYDRITNGKSCEDTYSISPMLPEQDLALDSLEDQMTISD